MPLAAAPQTSSSSQRLRSLHVEHTYPPADRADPPSVQAARPRSTARDGQHDIDSEDVGNARDPEFLATLTRNGPWQRLGKEIAGSA